jgi:hypothetical protein
VQLTHKKVMAFAIGFSAVLVAVVLVAIALSGARQQHSFAIYLVKGLDTAAARAMALDELPLEAEPVLTDQDLTAYHWPSHTLALADEEAVLARLPQTPVHGLPFVVMANGERIYLGAFWTSFSSQSVDLPVIDTLLRDWTIRPGYPWVHQLDPDPRGDARIRKALRNLGKLIDE